MTGLHRRTVNAWLAIVAGAVLLASLIAIGLSARAVMRLDDARTLLIDRVGLARTTNLQLSASYVNQETGVRGFIITGEESFLQPDRQGRADERAARARLDPLMEMAELDAIRPAYRRTVAAMARWRREYAEPSIAATRADVPARESRRTLARGKALFDAVRTRGAELQSVLDRERNAARTGLSDAARDLKVFLAFAAALILLAAAAAFATLRRVVIGPLASLGASVRAVRSGDFSRRVAVDGPREITMLAEDVDDMRERLAAELAAVTAAEEQLREQALELQRSNNELEQFAYVASHDLQEPLRKIVSFNQMLEKRYKGQLDDRADQYIGFAVDGARRMQILINDLLAFSRVGRVGGQERAAVGLDVLVEDACDALSEVIAETGATVEHHDLPVVHADRALLTTVLQNLIANGIKFRGEQPPVVRVTARRDGDVHEVAVSDNGIGIEPEYADRIFIIFQRLHARSEYEGTGIGLAMCRKIVEHHGGRIWLDTTVREGTTFRFTLPITEDTA